MSAHSWQAMQSTLPFDERCYVRGEFDGDTYDRDEDHDRLSTQLTRVRSLMLDGTWRTLHRIAEVVGGSEAGVSARLRDLRKPRNGKYQVDRRRISGGLYEYRIATKCG